MATETNKYAEESRSARVVTAQYEESMTFVLRHGNVTAETLMKMTRAQLIETYRGNAADRGFIPNTGAPKAQMVADIKRNLDLTFKRLMGQDW